MEIPPVHHVPDFDKHSVSQNDTEVFPIQVHLVTFDLVMNDLYMSRTQYHFLTCILKTLFPTICKVPATEKEELSSFEFQVLASARMCFRLNYGITKHMGFHYFYYSEAEINIYIYL